MNYFEFYDLPVSFEIDEALLKRLFLAKSKQYHPDFYTLASEEEQTKALEMSTFNNEAYKTLSDFDRRIKYILQLKGVLQAEGQNKVPQSFLMEMMDVNEALMELEMDFDAEQYDKVCTEIADMEAALLQNIQPTFRSFHENTDTNLEKVKEYYLKKRYLLRIKENLNKFAPQS